jgi:streptogramin lyase
VSALRGTVTVRSAEPPALDVTEPFAVALAPNGRVLVADRAANRIVSIDPATRQSTVIAGTGRRGSAAAPRRRPRSRRSASHRRFRGAPRAPRRRPGLITTIAG